jgi:hypothetical protein
MENLEDYLTKIIEKAVREAISEEMSDIHKIIRQGITPQYMTKEKVIELTGWSGRTIQHLRDTNQIDYIQHGRKILYPTDALYIFFENHRIKRRVK